MNTFDQCLSALNTVDVNATGFPGTTKASPSLKAKTFRRAQPVQVMSDIIEASLVLAILLTDIDDGWVWGFVATPCVWLLKVLNAILVRAQLCIVQRRVSVAVLQVLDRYTGLLHGLPEACSVPE